MMGFFCNNLEILKALLRSQSKQSIRCEDYWPCVIWSLYIPVKLSQNHDYSAPVPSMAKSLSAMVVIMPVGSIHPCLPRSRISTTCAASVSTIDRKYIHIIQLIKSLHTISLSHLWYDSDYPIIGLNNSLSAVRCQTIIWTNAESS